MRRLRTDYLDLYLLRWRGPVPLAETVMAFGALVDAGKIRGFGVSNFDVGELVELLATPGGSQAQTDQVLYNVARRGVEYELVPWCLEIGLPIMASSPIEQGRLLRHPALEQVAVRHGATPGQVALAWVLHHDDVAAIPKAGTPAHVREDRGALDVHLTEDDLARLDRAFPAPTAPRPLEML